MGKKPIRLSKCMIVKNEEESIAKALASGKDSFCEQIVVDTGSTDRTAEIAREMGANVFSYEWNDDFAAARNFAMSKASGNWIIFLDGDEFFAPETEKHLIPIVERMEQQRKRIDAAWVSIWNLADDGERVASALTFPRIIRNDTNLKYQGRIHEVLQRTDGECLELFDAADDITLLHTGYQKKVIEKKTTRNVKLIQMALEDNPNDFYMMSYLGDEYVNLNRYDEAVDCYWKAIQSMETRNSFSQRSAQTFVNLMLILLEAKKDYKELERVYRIAVSHMPKEQDFDYFYGIALVQQECLAEGKQHLETALQKLEHNRVNGSAFMNTKLPEVYMTIAWCSLKTGDANRAVEICVQLLKQNPSDVNALRILLLAFRGDGILPVVSPEQVVGFLGKICDLRSVAGRYRVLYLAKEGVYPELGAYMEDKMFSPEEKEGLKKAGL